MSLRRVEVATRVPYTVTIGPGALASLGESLRADERSVLVSDTNVAPLYAERLLARAAPRFEADPGESAKSFGTLERVLDFLLEAGLDRNAVLIALGGGVVGDLTGLAASLFMRGIDAVQAPTTLLAQVDASVGGKTAVNLAGGKNLAGTFHQPRAVYCDTDTLASLPERELRSGLGEVVKTALLSGPEFLGFLEEHAARLTEVRDGAFWGEVVERCVQHKAAVVTADERESGLRKTLNLGHTFAHAIEHAAGFGRIPHGVAVGCGLGLAARLSERLGLLEAGDLAARVEALLEALGLQPTLDALRARFGQALEPESLLAGMRHDKKGAAGEPSFVLLEAAGKALVGCKVDERDVLTSLS